MLLALETANDQCSVALWNESGLQAFQHDGRAREQTRVLLPMVEAVLAETGQTLANLSAIAFSRGPGSFNGIRINAAVAQALGWAQDIPLIPVSTLEALARSVDGVDDRREGNSTCDGDATAVQRILAVLDARMQELYSGFFEQQPNGQWHAVGAEQLCGYGAIQWPANWDASTVWTMAGSGCPLTEIPEMLAAPVRTLPNCLPDARHIAAIGWEMLQQGTVMTAGAALPVYLRDDAWKKKDAQQAAKQSRP